MHVCRYYSDSIVLYVINITIAITITITMMTMPMTMPMMMTKDRYGTQAGRQTETQTRTRTGNTKELPNAARTTHYSQLTAYCLLLVLDLLVVAARLL